MNKLLLKEFVPAGSYFHVARIECTPAKSPSVHTHDFAEVFWIERGRGVHLINGKKMPLIAGDVVPIRAPDRHGFRTADAGGFTMVNVAFASSAPRRLQSHYVPDSKRWPWIKGAKPRVYHLDGAILLALSRWADELATAPQSQLELDRFLLNFLHATASSGEARGPATPEWLRAALSSFSDPTHLSEGTAALARLSDRCPEHLNRVVRRHFGKTTTDLVNELRLDYAGRQLQMTSRPIIDVAADCGLNNLGYFYRLFHQRYAMTPRQFRISKHAVVR